MPDLTIDQRHLLGRIRILGGQIPLELSDSELIEIIAVIFSDINRPDLCSRIDRTENCGINYFDRPLSDFLKTRAIASDLKEAFLIGVDEIRDFSTYLQCLCEIHKRRRKYARILEQQPFPIEVQVAPRAMLEFGLIENEALSSWLTWRKWMFDIDNRSAQETGYMFEPILAHALGGQPYSSAKSPIRRRADNAKGRQLDCLVDHDAYEFKLRVTIAASGQGRFVEEKEFPADCAASGYKPILVVLDPTPNAHLTEPTAAFEQNGGKCYLGEQAWRHLEQRAGPTMAQFLERYVRKPLATTSQSAPQLLDLSLKTDANSSIILTLSSEKHSFQRVIKRSPDPILADE